MAQTSQEFGDRPPSYTAPNAVPMNSGAVPSQQFAITPQPGAMPHQQGFIVQNVPVVEETNCCAGRSDGFKFTAGVITGAFQLVIAVICIVLSIIAFVLVRDMENAESALAFESSTHTVGASIILFIPAGILGVLTKFKSNCVIIGYLVMSILSAVDAFCVVGIQSLAVSIFFFDASSCPPTDYIDYEISGIIPEIDLNCRDQGITSVSVIHIVLAIICFIEFIVAVVAAAYCCGGLECCCKSTMHRRTITMMNYNPLINEQQSSAMQIQGQLAGGEDALPQKA